MHPEISSGPGGTATSNFSSDRDEALTLCKGKEGYYWPGTGAEFPQTQGARALVEKLRPELSADQKVFEQCEDP